MDKLWGDDKDDLGCYGDGTNGVRLVNSRLADCLEDAWLSNYGNHPYAVSQKHINSLLDVLRGSINDASIDAADEAIDILNTHFVTNGCYFGFFDGDLLLTTDLESNHRKAGR